MYKSVTILKSIPFRTELELTFHARLSIMNFTVLETPHVLVGAAIAMNIPNPVIAIPLALGSHFVLELVPHWNPHLNTEVKKYGRVTRNSFIIVLADAMLALVSGLYIASMVLPDTTHFLTIILACFFSVLPDVVEAPYFFLGIKSKTIDKWIKIQKSFQEDAEVLPGIATQIITIVSAIWWIR